MNLKLGILGFGRIGAEHAGWVANAAGIEVHAAVDATPARQALAQQRRIMSFESLEHMVRDQPVDAVLVATPTAMHYDHAMAALSAGKHVMVEKPVCLNLAQAQELAAEAARRGLVLSVYHNRRWDVDYLTAAKAIRQGVFGRVFNVESRICQWASCVGPAAKEWNPNWRNEAAFGGGGLYDWGSHLIDQLWQLMLPARPVRVFAQLRGNVWSADCDDLARVCVEFSDGAIGLVEINTTTTRPLPRWRIDGEKGSADSPHSDDYDTNRWAQFTFDPADGSGPRLLEPARDWLTPSQIWERFAAACRGVGEPAVNVASALVTMGLLDAARTSSLEGRAVDVDFSNRLQSLTKPDQPMSEADRRLEHG
jgi:predicted dehydrogenase